MTFSLMSLKITFFLIKKTRSDGRGHICVITQIPIKLDPRYCGSNPNSGPPQLPLQEHLFSLNIHLKA